MLEISSLLSYIFQSSQFLNVDFRIVAVMSKLFSLGEKEMSTIDFVDFLQD